MARHRRQLHTSVLAPQSQLHTAILSHSLPTLEDKQAPHRLKVWNSFLLTISEDSLMQSLQGTQDILLYNGRLQRLDTASITQFTDATTWLGV